MYLSRPSNKYYCICIQIQDVDAHQCLRQPSSSSSFFLFASLLVCRCNFSLPLPPLPPPLSLFHRWHHNCNSIHIIQSNLSKLSISYHDFRAYGKTNANTTWRCQYCPIPAGQIILSIHYYHLKIKVTATMIVSIYTNLGRQNVPWNIRFELGWCFVCSTSNSNDNEDNVSSLLLHVHGLSDVSSLQFFITGNQKEEMESQQRQFCCW